MLVERHTAQPEELRIIVVFHKVSQENPAGIVNPLFVLFTQRLDIFQTFQHQKWAVDN